MSPSERAAFGSLLHAADTIENLLRQRGGASLMRGELESFTQAIDEARTFLKTLGQEKPEEKEEKEKKQ